MSAGQVRGQHKRTALMAAATIVGGTSATFDATKPETTLRLADAFVDWLVDAEPEEERT